MKTFKQSLLISLPLSLCPNFMFGPTLQSVLLGLKAPPGPYYSKLHHSILFISSHSSALPLFLSSPFAIHLQRNLLF